LTLPGVKTPVNLACRTLPIRPWGYQMEPVSGRVAEFAATCSSRLRLFS